MHLALDDLRLLFYAHPDRLTEGLQYSHHCCQSTQKLWKGDFDGKISCVRLICMALHSSPTCVIASVFDISREKISLAAIIANGVSGPSALAMPMAMAVLPVPG